MNDQPRLPERQVLALESIARSLEKIANPALRLFDSYELVVELRERSNLIVSKGLQDWLREEPKDG